MNLHFLYSDSSIQHCHTIPWVKSVVLPSPFGGFQQGEWRSPKWVLCYGRVGFLFRKAPFLWLTHPNLTWCALLLDMWYTYLVGGLVAINIGFLILIIPIDELVFFRRVQANHQPVIFAVRHIFVESGSAFPQCNKKQAQFWNHGISYWVTETQLQGGAPPVINWLQSQWQYLYYIYIYFLYYIYY